MNRFFSRVAGTLALVVVVPFAPSVVSTAGAAPMVPDDLPFFPEVQQNPQISVTTEDGRSVDGLTVHRGDTLLVHGTGFSPQANQGGFPLPIPPGVPNGVYVLYSAFPDHWEPSEDAPAVSRKHPHDRMAWVTPAGTLEAIPRAPIDMHRSISRVAQPMADDGSFTARIEVDPAATTPGGNWGVYVYSAAGSANAAEEFYVPINYSPEPGPNTPPPASPDLVLDAGVVHQVTDTLQGGINPRFGADEQDGQRVSFTRDHDAEDASDDGIQRYRGTVTATARFNMVEVAMKDPWIETRADGARVLTALVSQRHDVGADLMHRVELGTLGPVDAVGEQPVVMGPATLGHVAVNG